MHMSVQTNANKVEKNRNITKFFKSVRAELKKVIWPNKKDLISYTSVVLVTCGIAGIGIWLVDMVFAKILQFIIK
jgi:preprotein translocase subunit SecE